MENGTTIRQPNTENKLHECLQYHKRFVTLQGLKIHQGKTCMKNKKCRSSDRKTRIRSTQEANHSGQIKAAANSEKQESPSESEVFERKAKVAWPAAKEKASYKSFEDEVLKKTKKDKGTAKDKSSKLAKTIYAVGMESFGEEPGNKKKVTRSHGASRRERRMRKLKEEKKNLQRRWRGQPLKKKKDLQSCMPT